jgi:hypothetical protein
LLIGLLGFAVLFHLVTAVFGFACFLLSTRFGFALAVCFGCAFPGFWTCFVVCLTGFVIVF